MYVAGSIRDSLAAWPAKGERCCEMDAEGKPPPIPLEGIAMVRVSFQGQIN